MNVDDIPGTDRRISDTKTRPFDLIIPQSEVQAGLNRIARDSLRPVALGLGMLYLVAAVVLLAFDLDEDNVRLAALAGGLATAYLGLGWVLRRWTLPPRWAHPLGVVLAGLALVAATARQLTVAWDVLNPYMLITIGIGILFLDLRWWVVANALVVAVWFAVRQQAYPAMAETEFVVSVVASLMMSLVALVLRVQALGRAERLRLAESAYIHALQQAAQRAQASEIRFHRLADAAFEGIVVHDGETILDANRALLAMFGLALEDMVGRPTLDFLTPDSHEIVEQKLQSRDEQPYEATALRPDGTTFPIELCGRTIGEGDDVLRVVAVRDITERKQAEAERERLIAELDAFAHTVAHDLKNPLNLVLAYSDLLTDELHRAPAAELEQFVRGVAEGARKMERIIDELLVLAQTSQSDVPVSSLNMPAIVGEACRMLAPMIDEAGAELVVGEDWPEAMGVAPWIEHVWMNYLSNAIKYGGRPPRIELGADPQPDSKGMVRFWVRDNGPGLSPEQHEAIFRPFTRLGSRQQEGHGLGLSIVRRIVTRLGGDVGVESVPGEGCTFYFTLPAATQAEGQTTSARDRLQVSD